MLDPPSRICTPQLHGGQPERGARRGTLYGVRPGRDEKRSWRDLSRAPREEQSHTQGAATGVATGEAVVCTTSATISDESIPVDTAKESVRSSVAVAEEVVCTTSIKKLSTAASSTDSA